jgi:outer membrane receptor protein involved in Fe transport
MPKMRTLRVWTSTLLACLLAVGYASAQAQITTGVIQGSVLDPTGAALPGVDVEARNVDTNIVRRQSTGGEGRFTLLQLQPGTYSVTFTLSGFATLVQEDVRVSVGQTITLNPTMKLAATSETVTVTGTATVDTRRTESSSTINQTSIETTPVLGRKFEDLLSLTPGVSIVQGPDGDEITFAGQRGIFNNISLDGGDYNNGFFGEQMGGQRAGIDITMDAIKEFQVVATGANAEYGRTAGGVVNVITKSGTNELHGSVFHFQRLEALTGDLSDGTKLEDFHREQFGGTLGGPLKKDKAFFFVAAEGITGNFERPNLSVPIGSPCPVSNPTVSANEALINSNPDCQRTALLNFFQTRLGQDEGQPVEHPIDTKALLLKLDWLLNPSNTLSFSYNFNHSRKENETFDVATYGTSANGIEGDPARIHVANLNLFSTLSATTLNELHVTYSRESRPRVARDSNLLADTGMGFAPSFRFGNPFFLQPNVDELIWRTQLKNNFSLIRGKHTIKVGGEWIHTLNDQVFRGFFTGRYLFDSVTGFLRYASPAAAGGYGPATQGCSNGSFVTFPTPCPAGTTATGGPLLFYLQGAGRTGLATDATGASNITNDEFALFIQDTWQVTPRVTLNYGLRWDAQFMPETVDPTTTAYAPFLNDPRFPSDGTIPDQTKQFQPRLGVAWDVKGNQRSVVRASAGIYYARQNMLSQVGSVTTNGLQQQSIFRNSTFVSFADMPVWPNVLTPAPLPAGTFPDFSGVRVFDREYKNPRIFSANLAYEQELAPNLAGYVDLTWAEGDHLTRFININRADRGAPFAPRLDEVMVTTSIGESRYRGMTLGLRKRFSDGWQMEANYVLSKDDDHDSNERDPFTDRSFDPVDFEKDWGPSDRDIRHKFNFYAYGELPWGLQGNGRIQARGAQPITASPRVQNGVDLGRNSLRKDNKYFSFDWRLQRPFKLGKNAELIPIIEMFNTFNSDNNVNPLSTPALFNFDGFLRTGVGDPRQTQLALKLTF